MGLHGKHPIHHTQIQRFKGSTTLRHFVDTETTFDGEKTNKNREGEIEMCVFLHIAMRYDWPSHSMEFHEW